MGSEEHPGTDPAPAPSGRRGSRPAGTPQLEKLLVRDWGAPFLRDPVDLVRLSFMVGAAALIVAGELGQAVRLGLTMVLVLVPRLLRLPRLFDLGFILGMSLQAWGNVFGLFESISGWTCSRTSS
ncbi:MAG: hypothetical protein EDQ89_03690 [Acidobacteria bacterium]|nr:MAG: hypothetical protein EDQ89_03690 [Acidobacteriota bacterium]